MAPMVGQSVSAFSGRCKASKAVGRVDLTFAELEEVVLVVAVVVVVVVVAVVVVVVTLFNEGNT